MCPAKRGRGRPPKRFGRGKGRTVKRRLCSKKSGTQGTARAVRRAAARGNRKGRTKEKGPRAPIRGDAIAEVSPVGTLELRKAISVLVRRMHAGAQRDEWPAIAKEIAELVAVDQRLVMSVLERVAEGDVTPEQNRPGQGRPFRIKAGTPECDRLVGGLLAGFGARHTATFINSLPESRGKPSVGKTVVIRSAKRALGLVVSRAKVTKTGSRDKASEWAKSRFVITTKFRDNLRRGVVCLEQTLFVDEHDEWCVLGAGGHSGNSSRHEWRAHRDAEGNICLPENGGVLDPQVPRPRAKHPARAGGLFGVAATIPRGGRRVEGRRIPPFRYRSRVVGIQAYERALKTEIERVRSLGLRNRANVADPDKRSQKGVWYDHVGDPDVNPYEVSSFFLCALEKDGYSRCFPLFSRATARIGSRTSPRSST